MKPKTPTRDDLEAAAGKTVPDVIAHNLQILFCGINPGLYTAAIGHHFGRPGNRFWPALYDAGFTERQFTPYDERQLLQHGCGVTNLVARATAAASELNNDEFRTGAARLRRKVGRYRPGCVAFLGVTAYRTAFERPQAQVGRQAKTIGPAAVWVLPNPSGLNAHYQRQDFARLFAELREAFFTRG